MKRVLFVVICGFFLLAACRKENPEQPQKAAAPVLLSSIPADGATAVSRKDLEIVLHFDQSVFCPVAKRSKISVQPQVEITKITQSGADLRIALAELDYLTSYTLTLPEGCISGYKDNIAPQLSLSFTTEEQVIVEKDVDSKLSNPNASANAKKLYERLLGIYGEHSLSGAMGGTAWETSFTDYIQKQTGIYPAIVGFDYLFNNWPAKAWDACPDYEDISIIRNVWKAGCVIQIGWHWNMPRSEGESNPSNFSFYNHPVQAKRVATEGTWENAEMKRQVAQIAGFLQLLQKEDIPVLWRPLHEAAGDYTWGAWFWWGNGGSEPCKAIWRYMYDVFTKEYGLNNLIWVWTSQCSNAGALADVSLLKDWYPGHDCVDIVGADLYLPKGSTSSQYFNLVNESVEGRKMVALSEFGNLPNLDENKENDALWLYYLNWSSFENGKPVFYSKNADGSYGWNNTAQEWKAVLSSELTFNRGYLQAEEQ